MHSLKWIRSLIDSLTLLLTLQIYFGPLHSTTFIDFSIIRHTHPVWYSSLSHLDSESTVHSQSDLVRSENTIRREFTRDPSNMT
ncbi:hypothetical protein BDZ97DRAFT_192257 [Flammula alnicola]|nr:hypothetical protein BDZ97DRAFT_192257 [Flammula alnicola]